MRRIISFMHISLDGFVAGPAGEMNWIKIDQELFDHVGKRISRGDTALYGRVTYQMMESYWPTAGDKPGASRHDIEHAKWYRNAKKIVLSRTLKDSNPKTTIIGGDIKKELRAIQEQPGGEILLFGSPGATHSLLELDLIDGYWLFVNPIVLGEGIPLFKGVTARANLKLVSTRTFSSGVTEVSYVREV